jgi:hypothetical protein
VKPSAEGEREDTKLDRSHIVGFVCRAIYILLLDFLVHIKQRNCYYNFRAKPLLLVKM